MLNDVYFSFLPDQAPLGRVWWPFLKTNNSYLYIASNSVKIDHLPVPAKNPTLQELIQAFHTYPNSFYLGEGESDLEWAIRMHERAAQPMINLGNGHDYLSSVQHKTRYGWNFLQDIPVSQMVLSKTGQLQISFLEPITAQVTGPSEVLWN